MVTELQRTAFKTSRKLEFFSERELAAQTGHQRSNSVLTMDVMRCAPKAASAGWSMGPLGRLAYSSLANFPRKPPGVPVSRTVSPW